LNSFLQAIPPRYSRVAACLLAALTAFFTYQSCLQNDFTGSDILTLIQSGRVQSMGDLTAIFFERMMSGTAFEGVFYRPISVLSFQLDYLIWGANPFGYHLTDLMLHILVTVGTFLLGLRLTGGMLRTSLLAALLFTSHPLLVETVPSIARRQDILEALFLILAFQFYLRSRSGYKRSNRAASLGFFILALGTKETAILIPGLVFFHALVFSDGFGRRARLRWKESFRTTLPYLLICFLYLAWRFHVLGGLGEDRSELSPLWITAHYFCGLLYPQNFLSLQRGPKAVAVLAALIPVLVFLVVTFSRSMRSHRDSGSLALYSLLVMWVLIPLPILVITGSFAYRSLYSTVVPLSLLLSVVLARGLSRLWTMKASGRVSWNQLTAREFFTAGLVASTGILAASLVAFTPLIRDYPQWRESGRVTQQVLALLNDNLDRFPRNAVLTINGLPKVSPPTTIFSVRGTHSVSYLRDYSIQSWLDLRDDARGMKVVAGKPHVVPTGPCDLDLQINRITSGAVDVTFVWNQPECSP
jgi:hypothetical protein